MRNLFFMGLLALAAPATAQGVPEPIKARVNELVAVCARAGGTLGAMTGQGQFVIPRDFTGDGKTDFIVSEGNFPCTGRPGLFRAGGTARLQLFAGDGAGGAALLFDDMLIGYRLLDGKPVRVQIARAGSSCGGPARCGDELRWNAATRGFDLVATDGRKIAPRPVGLAAAPASSVPSPVTSAGGGMVAASSAPATLPLLPNAEAQFKARCRKEIVAQDPRNAKWVDGHCTEAWKNVVATGPAADALLNVLPTVPGAVVPLPAAKTRMTGVRWGTNQPGQLATGKLGVFEAAIFGKRTPETASLSWWKVGTPIPFDMAGAMEARGAKLTMVSCEKIGVGEGNRTYSGTAPGRAPFSLSIDLREAPTASASSGYSAAVTLSGRAPPRGSLDCEGL